MSAAEFNRLGKEIFIGCLNFILGLCFFSASLGFAPAFLRSDIGVVAAFCLFAVSFVPFIVTYSKLGLNQDDESTEESERRQEALAKHMPHWKAAFNACFIAFILSMFFHAFIHPLYVFMAAGSFLSAYWFLHVFPVAKKVLKEPDQPPGQTPGNKP